MFGQVTLVVTHGANEGQEYTFVKPGRCIVGRAEDCGIQVPMAPENLDISRHHCVFEFEPAGARVRDLGSANGTFVNGMLIGKRAKKAADTDLPRQATLILRDGDEVRVGHMAFRVEVHEEALVGAGRAAVNI